jgi:hypothetical protein
MQEEPLLTSQGSGQRAACHFPLEGSIIRTGDAEATFDDAVIEMQEESLTNEDPSPGET